MPIFNLLYIQTHLFAYILVYIFVSKALQWGACWLSLIFNGKTELQVSIYHYQFCHHSDSLLNRFTMIQKGTMKRRWNSKPYLTKRPNWISAKRPNQASRKVPDIRANWISAKRPNQASRKVPDIINLVLNLIACLLDLLHPRKAEGVKLETSHIWMLNKKTKPSFLVRYLGIQMRENSFQLQQCRNSSTMQCELGCHEVQ